MKDPTTGYTLMSRGELNKMNAVALVQLLSEGPILLAHKTRGRGAQDGGNGYNQPFALLVGYKQGEIYVLPDTSAPTKKVTAT